MASTKYEALLGQLVSINEQRRSIKSDLKKERTALMNMTKCERIGEGYLIEFGQRVIRAKRDFYGDLDVYEDGKLLAEGIRAGIRTIRIQLALGKY